jgi:transcriptional regulator with GAF, ATPase, and Fis domain
VAIIIAMAEHQLREEALIAIGKDFNSVADLDTLMRDVVVQATKILRADDCSLFLDIDSDERTLELAASHGPLSEQVGRTGTSYAVGEGLTGWVAQHEAVIRVGDPRTDPRWKGLFMEAPAGEIAAVMAVPVKLGAPSRAFCASCGTAKARFTSCRTSSRRRTKMSW